MHLLHLRMNILFLIAFICSLAGCSISAPHLPTSPYAESQGGAMRNPLEAQRLTLQAADLIESDPDRAELLLREALVADVYHGPAHNNLGVLFLGQDKLYEAANEFEWARKLLPGHPDPRLNLAFTLESAGRYDEALATYGTALEVYPNHLPTIQALTRLQIMRNRADSQTLEFLREIALRSDSIIWRKWAKGQLTRHDEG